jgi:hypothetical protein
MVVEEASFVGASVDSPADGVHDAATAARRTTNR